MRKLLISLLLAATAVTPALAQRGEDGRGGGGRSVQRESRAQQPRIQRSEARPQYRAQSAGARQPQRAETRQQFRERSRQPSAVRAAPQRSSPPARAVQRNNNVGAADVHRAVQQRREYRQRNDRNGRPDFQRDRRDDRQDFNRDRRDDRRDWRNGQYDNRRDYRRDGRNTRQDYRRDDRRDFRNDQRWSRDWRNDRRYDWRNYRNDNRDRYRMPRYYPPRNYGYGYRRYSIGVTIGSMFYGSNYWINDPWQYRLPAAYGGYRWVRYYDDALLVDTYSGEVVDVIHDFFY